MIDLAQLRKNTITGLWMNKRYERAVGSRAGFLIDHTCSAGLQFCYRGYDISNFVGQMVDSRAIFFQELGNRTIFTNRLQQFNLGVTNPQHSDPHLLFSNLFDPQEGHAKAVAIKRDSGIQRLHRYANMVNFVQHSSNLSVIAAFIIPLFRDVYRKSP